MPEEEPGFTFVDKRHAPADAADPAPAPDAAPEAAAPEAAAPPDMPDDDSLGEGYGNPDVYGVIGYCISLLATEAWQKLGLLADPKTGEAMADLAQAKAAIDAVGDLAARLEAAPADAVPDALRRDLRTLLNDLRLNYVSRRGDAAASRN